MNLAFQRKIKQDNRVYSVVLSTKKACGSFFKLHEKRCFTIFTLSQSDDRLTLSQVFRVTNVEF